VLLDVISRCRGLRDTSEAVDMKGGFDRRKSLQELERKDWGEPSNGETSLVSRCLSLRRKPLDQFTAEDLRLMIGQQISLSFLVPLAVERLDAEPLVEARYFPGDLLSNVLRVDEVFWSTHSDSLLRIRGLLGRFRDTLPSLDEIDRPAVERLLTEAPLWLTSM
jgi:hypothetical protein